MFYWFFILFLLLVVSVMSIGRGYESIKKYYGYFCLFLIYMSMFRYGLGQDYEGYIRKIDWYWTLENLNILEEPLFSCIAYGINHYSFITPVSFFGLMSILILVGIFSFYIRNENRYIILTICFFCLFPSLFYNTFNIVRQFAAAGIFYWSIKYIEKRNIIAYASCIFVGMLIHLSTIILFPLYFILNIKVSRKASLLFFVLCLIIAASINPILALLNDLGVYTVYIDSDLTIGSSSVIYLYNIVGLVIFIKNEELNDNSYDIIATNLFLLLILFSDLAFINIYFYRISVFFLPVAAYVIPRNLAALFQSNAISSILTIIIAIALFVAFIAPNRSNKLIVPEKMLPISSLYDKNVFIENFK